MEKHTLKHGMIVRNPSHEDIDAIRLAAESAGIECEGFNHVKAGRYPNLWYYGNCEPDERCITACVEFGNDREGVEFMSADTFIKHINGNLTILHQQTQWKQQ